MLDPKDLKQLIENKEIKTIDEALFYVNRFNKEVVFYKNLINFLDENDLRKFLNQEDLETHCCDLFYFRGCKYTLYKIAKILDIQYQTIYVYYKRNGKEKTQERLNKYM